MKGHDGVSNAAGREAAYLRLFGEARQVWRQRSQRRPHIDIYCFGPGHAGGESFTLVTSGMSDQRLRSPVRASAEMKPRRAELIFYCAELRDDYAELMNRLAHMTVRRSAWMSQCLTIEPRDMHLLRNPDMRSLLFIPIAPQGEQIFPPVEVDGDPVAFLWVMPVTASECRLARQRGTWELLTLLDNRCQTHVVSPGRGIRLCRRQPPSRASAAMIVFRPGSGDVSRREDGSDVRTERGT